MPKIDEDIEENNENIKYLGNLIAKYFLISNASNISKNIRASPLSIMDDELMEFQLIDSKSWWSMCSHCIVFSQGNHFDSKKKIVKKKYNINFQKIKYFKLKTHNPNNKLGIFSLDGERYDATVL